MWCIPNWKSKTQLSEARWGLWCHTNSHTDLGKMSCTSSGGARRSDTEEAFELLSPPDAVSQQSQGALGKAW